jgi:hypothetical protein
MFFKKIKSIKKFDYWEKDEYFSNNIKILQRINISWWYSYFSLYLLV